MPLPYEEAPQEDLFLRLVKDEDENDETWISLVDRHGHLATNIGTITPEGIRFFDTISADFLARAGFKNGALVIRGGDNKPLMSEAAWMDWYHNQDRRPG